MFSTRCTFTYTLLIIPQFVHPRSPQHNLGNFSYTFYPPKIRKWDFGRAMSFCTWTHYHIFIAYQFNEKKYSTKWFKWLEKYENVSLSLSTFTVLAFPPSYLLLVPSSFHFREGPWSFKTKFSAKFCKHIQKDIHLITIEMKLVVL